MSKLKYIVMPALTHLYGAEWRKEIVTVEQFNERFPVENYSELRNQIDNFVDAESYIAGVVKLNGYGRVLVQ